MSLPVQPCGKMCFGPFEVDLETGELRKNRRKIHLQGKLFQVLLALLEQRGKLVNRETLRQRLWPGDTFVDFDNGLNTAVSKLREVLGDSAEDPRYIETLERRGYRFVATVKEFGIPPPSGQWRELDVQKKQIEPDLVVVEIAGRICFGPDCQQIEWLTGDLLRENQKRVVFDISRVTYIDSTGIGIIAVCFGKVMKAGGKLRIAGAKGIVEEVLRMTRIDTIVTLYPTAAAAVQTFQIT